MKAVTQLLSPFKLISTVAISFVLSFSNAYAEDGSALDKVYEATIHSYYSINGFYNFSANQGAQKDLADINASIDRLQELVNELQGDSESNGADEQFSTVSSSWKAYQKVLKQNIKEVKSTGYPDLRLAGDMASNNIALNTALNDLASTLGAITSKPNKTTELSRKAASNMALMMTKYSARTTSTVSQVYASGDVEKEVTIDELAQEFSAQLSELITLAEGNQNASKLLDSAQTKWDFIKNSYINYNENRVNFIVNLYSKKIVSNIEQALAAI